jgi:WD40 repeat protein
MGGELIPYHGAGMIAQGVVSTPPQDYWLPQDSTVRVLPGADEEATSPGFVSDGVAGRVFQKRSGSQCRLAHVSWDGKSEPVGVDTPALERSEEALITPRGAAHGLRRADGSYAWGRAGRGHSVSSGLAPPGPPAESWLLEAVGLTGEDAVRVEGRTVRRTIPRGTQWEMSREPSEGLPWRLHLPRWRSGWDPPVCAWAPGELILALAYPDQSVIIVDLRRGAPDPALRAPLTSTIETMAWSYDGRLALGCADDSVTVWDLRSGLASRMAPYDYDGVAKTCCPKLDWSPSGLLASSDSGGRIRVWKGAEARYELTAGPGTNVQSLSWSRGDTLALVTSDREGSDGEYEVAIWQPGWDARQLVTKASFGMHAGDCAWLGEHRLVWTQFEWSDESDDTILAVRVDAASVLLGGPSGPQIGHPGAGSLAFIACSDSGRVAAARREKGVLIWDGPIIDPPRALVGAEELCVFSMAWLPDGRLACVSFDDGVSVSVWSRDGHSAPELLECDIGEISVSRVSASCRGGRTELVSVTMGGQLRVWDIHTGTSSRVRAAITSDTRSDFEPAWGPAGRLAVLRTGVRTPEQTVLLLTPHVSDAGAARGGFEQTSISLPDEDFAPDLLAWSAEGWLALGGRDGRVAVYDRLPTSPIAWIQHGRGSHVTALAWGPEGQLAAGYGDGSILVFDGLAGRQLWRFRLDSAVNVLAWSIDGQLASAGADGRVVAWESPPDDLPRDLGSHDDGVLDLAWSPGGRLASAAGDYLAVLAWDSAAEPPVAEHRDPGFAHQVGWLDERRAWVFDGEDVTVIDPLKPSLVRRGRPALRIDGSRVDVVPAEAIVVPAGEASPGGPKDVGGCLPWEPPAEALDAVGDGRHWVRVVDDREVQLPTPPTGPVLDDREVPPFPFHPPMIGRSTGEVTATSGPGVLHRFDRDGDGKDVWRGSVLGSAEAWLTPDAAAGRGWWLQGNPTGRVVISVKAMDGAVGGASMLGGIKLEELGLELRPANGGAGPGSVLLGASGRVLAQGLADGVTGIKLGATEAAIVTTNPHTVLHVDHARERAVEWRIDALPDDAVLNAVSSDTTGGWALVFSTADPDRWYQARIGMWAHRPTSTPRPAPAPPAATQALAYRPLDTDSP